MATRFLVASVLLCACSGSWSEPAGPNTWSVGCKRSRSNCYEEANRVCPRGFQVVDGDSSSGYVVSGNFIAPVYKGEMLVRCNTPAPVAAPAPEVQREPEQQEGVTIITRDVE